MAGKSEHPNNDEIERAQADAEAAMERASQRASMKAEADDILNAAKAAEAAQAESVAEFADGSDEAEGFADPMAFLAAELDKAETEKSEMKDQALRLAAEMENLRRRTQKDVKDAREFSIAGFAKEMLAVSDNLRRALEAIPQESKDSDDAGFKALIEGVEMTERSMAQGLEKFGVKKLSPMNEKFNPNLHQAMFEMPNTEVPNNTILQIVQDGYVIGERCLRPAMVGVSKGGPKAAAAAPEETEEGET